MKFRIISICMGIVLLAGCAATTKTVVKNNDSINTLSENNKQAYDIVDKSESIYSGKDQISTLDFTILDKDGTKRQVKLRRYWKNYSNAKGDIQTKSVIFHLFPPESKDTAFMVWSYKHGTGKEDDQWLYLPILRKVNKLPGRDETGFHGSDLKAEDMITRPAGLDTHTLVKEDNIDGVAYYVIESIPKSKENDFEYGKLIKWIRKDNYLKEFVEYYNYENKLVKKAHFYWKDINNAKVWTKVELENPNTNGKTTLKISDIQVDAGIADKTFSERIMKLGLDAIK